MTFKAQSVWLDFVLLCKIYICKIDFNLFKLGQYILKNYTIILNFNRRIPFHHRANHEDLNRNINPAGYYIYDFTYFNMVPLQNLKHAVGKIISSYKITCLMPSHRPRKSRCCDITTSTHTAITL